MSPCDQHPWGLADGLVCTGVGTPHAHVYVASGVPDAHDVTERAAEEARG